MHHSLKSSLSSAGIGRFLQKTARALPPSCQKNYTTCSFMRGSRKACVAYEDNASVLVFSCQCEGKTIIWVDYKSTSELQFYNSGLRRNNSLFSESYPEEILGIKLVNCDPEDVNGKPNWDQTSNSYSVWRPQSTAYQLICCAIRNDESFRPRPS